MRPRHRAPSLLFGLGAAVALGLQAAPAGAHPGGRKPGDGPLGWPCAPSDTVQVPGAAAAVTACLPDLTTAGLLQAPAGEFTDRADWITLHAPGTSNPSGVPGLQVDGYFPDTSTLNTTHGWNHDSQFVLRIPDAWNGGLVVTGAPGVRKQYACKQYACDFLISDFVLERGFAYACTDKGNNGPDFYRTATGPATRWPSGTSG